MQKITLTKKSDENNLLGWDKIEIMGVLPWRSMKLEDLVWDEGKRVEKRDGYGHDNMFLCVADGMLIMIDEEELFTFADCYNAAAG